MGLHEVDKNIDTFQGEPLTSPPCWLERVACFGAIKTVSSAFSLCFILSEKNLVCVRAGELTFPGLLLGESPGVTFCEICDLRCSVCPCIFVNLLSLSLFPCCAFVSTSVHVLYQSYTSGLVRPLNVSSNFVYLKLLTYCCRY